MGKPREVCFECKRIFLEIQEKLVFQVSIGGLIRLCPICYANKDISDDDHAIEGEKAKKTFSGYFNYLTLEDTKHKCYCKTFNKEERIQKRFLYYQIPSKRHEEADENMFLEKDGKERELCRYCYRCYEVSGDKCYKRHD